MNISTKSANLMMKYGFLFPDQYEGLRYIRYLTSQKSGRGAVSMSQANHLKVLCGGLQERLSSVVRKLRPYAQIARTEKFGDCPMEEVDRLSVDDAMNLIIGYYPKEANLDVSSQRIPHPNYHGLDAWLAEGIKAKKYLLDRVLDADLADFVLEEDDIPSVFFDYPELEFEDLDVSELDTQIKQLKSKQPCSYYPPSEDEALHFVLSEERLAEYHNNIARVSILGAYIHPNGPLHLIHDDSGYVQAYSETGQLGGDACVMMYKRIYDGDEIAGFRELYDDLQAQHRQAQAEINGARKLANDYITQWQQAEEERYKTANAEYMTQLKRLQQMLKEVTDAYNRQKDAAIKVWESDRSQAYAEWDSMKNQFQATLRARKSKIRKEIADLMIFIPNIHRDMVETLKEHSPKTEFDEE